jgi:phosphoglucosamine mutase
VSLRFGTDGVRGVAGTELTADLALALGRAAARVLSPPGGAGRPSCLVGRDTRWSGPMLQAAFSAGLAAEGVDVVDVGVLPTPGVAAAAADRQVPAAVISASHNPFVDNGIKLLAAGGRKLSDAEEETVESELESLLLTAITVPLKAITVPLKATAQPGGHAASPPGQTAAPRVQAAASRGQTGPPARSGDRLGRLTAEPEVRAWYCHRVVASLGGRSLGGVKVAIDCANGAAATTAATILDAAGADLVDVLAAAPDGININDGCGSTDPGGLARSVLAHGAQVGLAFDGDADRVIAVDDEGHVVDGDRLLALFATDLHSRGLLAHDTVVVTVMTNLGFHQAMAAGGIAVHQTPVGDRYVLEALDANGWSLGGEQSGHLIFRDLATTGDGVLSGLLLIDLLVRQGRPLAELAAQAMVRLPQVLRNVIVRDHANLDQAEEVWAEVRAVERELRDGGRVLLRPSGTERMVRVMVEAPTQAEATHTADRLAATVRNALGGPAGS